MTERKCRDCGEILAEDQEFDSEEDARKWENFLCLSCKTNLESLIDSTDMFHESFIDTLQPTVDFNSVIIKEEEMLYEEQIETISLSSNEYKIKSEDLIKTEKEENTDYDEKIHIQNYSGKQSSRSCSLKQKQWKKEDMEMAIENCRMGTMGYKRASKIFKVPKSTLARYVYSDKIPSELVEAKLGRKPIFSPQLEQRLAVHCMEMERRLFGLTRTDVRRLAFYMCKINCIENPFLEKNEMAGNKWLRQFLMRNKNLSIGKSYALPRGNGFTSENVQKFFEIYEPELVKVGGDPSRIYNCDEIGVTNVQQWMPEVITLRGKKAVQGLTSAERGNTVTITVCTNALGNFIPPLFIFPRVNMKKELMVGTPPGSIYSCNNSGWQTNETFLQWFEHFVRHAKPSQKDPVILILDSHYYHTRNPELIDCARNSHVIIIYTPPHTSNKMLPLDVAVMLPIKELYTKEIDCWQKQNYPRPIGTKSLGELFANAYYRAATPTNVMSGFCATGIYPHNPNIFTQNDFLQNEENEMDVNMNREINHEILEQVGSRELQMEDFVDSVDDYPSILPKKRGRPKKDSDDKLPKKRGRPKKAPARR